jgi:SAM-dependent methyltransferase
LDLHRNFTIRESSHRIINPLTPEKLATLGISIGLRPGLRLLDLCCGKGEMLATWARDHGTAGVGVDISTVFLAEARRRVAELNVADLVSFVHGDASQHVADEPVDVAACVGATWIGGGVAGTVELLARSLSPAGTMLIGEPYWRTDPPSDEAVRACHMQSREDLKLLPDLLAHMHDLGYDVVEMMLADEDSWDRYVAPQWRNVRLFLDEHPDDELAAGFREELRQGQLNYARYLRPLLGWGVFALRRQAAPGR